MIEAKKRFYIGILCPDGAYHSYHRIHKNGNVGTLLYVHGNPVGTYEDIQNCMTIITVGDYTIYTDFVREAKDFEKNNILRFIKINR